MENRDRQKREAGEDGALRVLNERGPQRIPSVSGDAAYRPHVFEMAEWLSNSMKALGIE